MTTAALALAAALAALLVVGFLAASLRRSRRATEARLEQSLGRLGERVDWLSSELADAIERAQDDTRRLRALDAVGRSLEIDEVLARTVDAAAALPGVAAAVVRVGVPGAGPLVAARGVDSDAATRHEVSGPPDDSRIRAVALSYHFHPEHEQGRPLRSAIAVPLELDGAAAGFLAVYATGADAALGAEAFAMLEAIAEQAGPALANAHRYQAASRQVTQERTELASRRAFHDALAREIARAHRSRRPLSLLVVDVDGLAELARKQGQAVAQAALGEVEEALRGATRETDVIGRVGVDAFAVALVGAPRIEAEAEFARIQATLRRGPRRADFPLAVSGGIAELRADDDAVSLLDLADTALRRAKTAGKGTAA